ncbi:MAG: transposase [Bacteroidales bacterium]|nr:transposase [Bacteroidales bacterium]
MSYTKNLFHIIFRTKNSKYTIPESSEKELYNYIGGIVKNKKSFLIEIGGIQNHIHLFVDLHPSISLSDFVKDIKVSTSIFFKQNKDKFPNFEGWGEGFGGFSYSFSHKDNVIKYIKNQKEHHKAISFENEYRSFLEKFDININEQYFLKD